MYYINELYKKSRPKTFMDYKPGEIPKKPTKAQEPLTLGEVAPKATERATSSASTTTQTRDPFLEGFYSTEDKPETERKTYLQHRTPINAETPKINSTYRQTNPYGSPVKSIANNVTGKDYDAFLDGFNDPYGEKREQAQLREAQAQRERNTSIPTSVNNRTLAYVKTTDPFLEGFNKDSTRQNEADKIKENRERKEDLLQRIYVSQVMATTPFPTNVLRAGIGRALEEHVKEKHYERNKHNVNLPQNQAEAIEWGWEPEVADCHQNTSSKDKPHIKYVSPNDKHRENIFDYYGNKVITAVEDEPTYNYASPDWPLEHGVLDILPWIRYGNEPEDPTTWYKRTGGALKHVLK